MFVKSIKIAKEAMFPIFRLKKLENRRNIAVVGTGFFINRRGYFVSVAHLFDNADTDTTFRYYGKLPDNLEQPALEIREIARQDEYDIFIGKVDIASPRYFYLDKNIPDVGKSVCISGYPLAKIIANSQGGAELGMVRRYFQPSFVLDRVAAKNNDRNGNVRVHDGFLVRDVGLFGMSGGPVFDVRGKVFGIQASVTEPRESKNSTGRTIVVENAIAIGSNRIMNFLKSQKVRVNRLGRL